MSARNMTGRHAADDSELPPSREELRRRRRQKARRRMLRRLTALLLVGVLTVVLWQNWDTLAPDKLLARWQDSMTDSGDGWPVDIAGASVTGLTRAASYTVAVSDSYLTYYNDRGGEANRYPCNYAAPLLRSAGRYVLLAQQNGQQARLSTRSLQLAEVTAPEKIIAVALNEKGQFAVLTQGTQGYTVQVTVYDRKGVPLYSRSRNLLATDVALSADGRQVALLSVEAENGVLHSVVEAFSLSSTDAEALISYTAQDTLLYRLAYQRNGRLAAVGENGALVLDNSGNPPEIYSAGDGRVLGYAAGDNCLALAVRRYGDTTDGQVTVLDGAGRERCTVPFTGEFRHLSADGHRFLLLTNGQAQIITTAGAGKSATLAADGQQAVLSGNSAIVLGLNAIQSYPLS